MQEFRIPARCDICRQFGSYLQTNHVGIFADDFIIWTTYEKLKSSWNFVIQHSGVSACLVYNLYSNHIKQWQIIGNVLFLNKFRLNILTLDNISSLLKYKHFSAEGRKAHWCLITGFLLLSKPNGAKNPPNAVDENAKPIDADETLISITNAATYKSSPKYESITKEIFQRSLDGLESKTILVLGRQSKSLVLGESFRIYFTIVLIKYL